MASLLVESTILLRNLLGEISDQRDVDTTDTTLLTRSVDLWGAGKSTTTDQRKNKIKEKNKEAVIIGRSNTSKSNSR